MKKLQTKESIATHIARLKRELKKTKHPTTLRHFLLFWITKFKTL